MNCLSLTRPSRWIRLLVVVAAFFMALVGLAKERTELTPNPSPAHTDGSPEGLGASEEAITATNGEETRLREGAEIVNELGEFQNAGGGIIFQPVDLKVEFQALENLALERISGALEEMRTPRLWSVSGTVTEFKSANYLLVKRAVLKTKGAVTDPRTAALER